MPQRRRTAVPTAMIAALITLGACEVDVTPASIPAPFSVAPVPSASAGRPAYVCTAVYKILTDGAVKLATGGEDRMRDTFAAMAADVKEAGATSLDTAQRAKVETIAASLERGAEAADPKAYLAADFPTIGRELDGTCT
ncbi:hypothetical protein [Actinoplanes sp. NPDC023714]|uniref:hypothetical protein n=1 Tax=Actinoplanes sp. NPDC023714 TaxID=3154322 RepID=UPI0034048EDC